MKKIVFIMLIVMCGMLLGGCAKKHTKSDVKKYVKEELGFDNVTVSSSPKVIENGKNYTDYLWTVTLNGEEEIVFNVIDYHSVGQVAEVSSLSDNYETVILKKLFGEYDGLADIELEEYEDKGMPCYRLVGEYESREELRKLFDELIDFSEYVEDTDYDITISVLLEHQNILRNQCEYELADGDIYINAEKITEADYEDALSTYACVCLSYRFEDQLEDFTDEELVQILKGYSKCISIQREDGTYEFYDDLCANKYGYVISYGALYEILIKEGFEVEGDCWAYSFVGVDGNEYEISHDFCDYVYEDVYGEDDNVDYLVNQGDKEGYYYIENGEKLPMSTWYVNYFTRSEIKEMTGLELQISEWE